MAGILRAARCVALSAMAIGFLLPLGGCDGLVDLLRVYSCAAGVKQACCEMSGSTADGCRASARTADVLLPASAVFAVDSTQLSNVAPLSDAACFPFGTDLTPSQDAVYAASGTKAWVSPGITGVNSAVWAGVSPSNLGLSGSGLRAARCAGDRFLAGTEKGLEWISLKDRSTGLFSSPSGFGSGVTAILAVDSTHVLAGTGPSGAGSILRCDVTTYACAATSGFDGQGVVSIVAGDSHGLTLALSRDSVSGAGTVYRSTDGGATWSKPAGVAALPYRGLCADPIPAPSGSPSHLYAWGSGLSVNYSGGGSNSWNQADPVLFGGVPRRRSPRVPSTPPGPAGSPSTRRAGTPSSGGTATRGSRRSRHRA